MRIYIYVRWSVCRLFGQHTTRLIASPLPPYSNIVLQCCGQEQRFRVSPESVSADLASKLQSLERVLGREAEHRREEASRRASAVSSLPPKRPRLWANWYSLVQG